jgi:hypothetical protein
LAVPTKATSRPGKYLKRSSAIPIRAPGRPVPELMAAWREAGAYTRSCFSST